MQIDVNISEITLDSIVGEIVRYDEDGDPIGKGGMTIAELVADKIVQKLIQDSRWPNLRDRMQEIRTEMIREMIRPTIEEAIARPIRKTNLYGEATGKETTLRELIADEARQQLTQPSDRYDRDKGTLLSSTIRTEVTRAFQEDVAATVKEVREKVAKEIGSSAAAKITAAAMDAITKTR